MPDDKPQDHVLAFDASSTQSVDKYGHMKVAVCNISKAAVNPYYGREIPKHEELGLDANRVYNLLRDPDELKKAASTFDGKPLLKLHKPQMAQDHDHGLTVGSVGKCSYEHPYLKTRGLSVWEGGAIAGIQRKTARELSSSYGYDADMTPGVYEGKPYDGVMRNLTANHVAIVEDGRAGSDVLVNDAAPKFTYFNKFEVSAMKRKNSLMPTVARGALMAYLGPKLAEDAQIDLKPIVKGLTGKNFATKIPSIKLALDKAMAKKGMLAEDAEMSDLVELLDELKPVAEEVEQQEAQPMDDDTTMPAEDDDTDMATRLTKVMTEMGLSEEQVATIIAAMKPEVEAKPPAVDEFPMKKPEGDNQKDMITKPAMDAAIEAAVAKERKKNQDAAAARAAVAPYIGPVDVAMDSADDIYKVALKANNVNITGVHPSAFPAMLALCPKPDAVPRGRRPQVAMDKASNDEYVTLTNNRQLKHR